MRRADLSTFNLDEYPTEEEEPAETKEEFEVWLATMGDNPDQLIAYAKDKGYQLDYTLDSLDTFKEFVKSGKINTDHALYYASGRYLGEVVRRNYKDDWRHGTRVRMYNILNEQY